MPEPDEQLAMLTADDSPALWVCPTCRGNRVMLREFYPDESTNGSDAAIEPCRTCYATGSLTFDPDDHSWCPY